jgi:hypothetical protein
VNRRLGHLRSVRGGSTEDSTNHQIGCGGVWPAWHLHCFLICDDQDPILHPRAV